MEAKKGDGPQPLDLYPSLAGAGHRVPGRGGSQEPQGWAMSDGPWGQPVSKSPSSQGTGWPSLVFLL